MVGPQTRWLVPHCQQKGKKGRPRGGPRFQTTLFPSRPIPSEPHSPSQVRHWRGRIKGSRQVPKEEKPQDPSPRKKPRGEEIVILRLDQAKAVASQGRKEANDRAVTLLRSCSPRRQPRDGLDDGSVDNDKDKDNLADK